MNGTGLVIVPPFGYSDLQPLQKTDRVLIPHGSTPQFCTHLNAIAISRSEFVAAGRDYPIAFSCAGEQNYAPVAILGLLDRQNLFINAAQEWEPGTYVPAFVRRYPFCLARLASDGTGEARRMICVEKAYVDSQGIVLYDDNGEPTAQWRNYERLLESFESDLDATALLCAMLARLDLFSPFTFQVMDGERTALTLKGMYRIDEQKLKDLRPASHKALVTKGLTSAIYAHIHSLDNFARLYARAVERAKSDERSRLQAYQR